MLVGGRVGDEREHARMLVVIYRQGAGRPRGQVGIQGVRASRRACGAVCKTISSTRHLLQQHTLLFARICEGESLVSIRQQACSRQRDMEEV